MRRRRRWTIISFSIYIRVAIHKVMVIEKNLSLILLFVFVM